MKGAVNSKLGIAVCLAALAVFCILHAVHRSRLPGFPEANARPVARSPERVEPGQRLEPGAPLVTAANSNAYPGLVAYTYGGNALLPQPTLVLQELGPKPHVDRIRVLPLPLRTGLWPQGPLLSSDGRFISMTGWEVQDSPVVVFLWDREKRHLRATFQRKDGQTPLKGIWGSHPREIGETPIRGISDTWILWSPDGRFIAFARGEPAPGGGGLRPLSDHLGIYDTKTDRLEWIARNVGVVYKAWTPEGTLLYATIPDPDPTPLDPDAEPQAARTPRRRARIYEVAAEGGIPRLIIPDVSDVGAGAGSGYGPLPVPSPDGRWIAIRDCPRGLDGQIGDALDEAYHGDHLLPPPETRAGGPTADSAKQGAGIFLYDRQTGQPRLLIPLQPQEAPLLFWTPDSRKLLRLDQHLDLSVKKQADTTAVLTEVDAATGKARTVVTLHARDEGSNDGDNEAPFSRDGSAGGPWQFEPAGVSADGKTAFLKKDEQYLADRTLLPARDAYARRRTLLAVDLASGAVTNVFQATGTQGEFAWAPGCALAPSGKGEGK